MQPILKRIRMALPSSSHLLVVGNKQDIGLTNLVRMEARKGKMKEVLITDRLSSSRCNFSAASFSDKATMMGLDHLERKSEGFVWRHHKIRSINDSKNYYHIVVDLLTQLLQNEKINLILFFEIPHLFADTLAYQIAKAKGIDTLILTPSIFPDRFFSLRQIDENGIWLSTSTCESPPIQIDSDNSTEWDYMKGTKQCRGELGCLTFRGIVVLLLHYFATKPFDVLKLKQLKQTIERMRQISSQLPRWRDPFKKYFHVRHLDYFEKLLEFENVPVDLSGKYVYFPLQLQPEMTTSSLGGDYSDQILAIVQLVKILPNDCLIFIKENPKQGGQMRGSHFFLRLQNLKNVRWLPSYINTHELIENSQFVSTITGTVGWEALCKGKKVLVFGSPWYRGLPGVIQFDDDVSFEYVSNYVFDHSELERKAGELFSRSHTGNIRPIKRRRTDGGYDTETNAHRVANTIIELLERRIETTFSS